MQWVSLSDEACKTGLVIYRLDRQLHAKFSKLRVTIIEDSQVQMK